MMNYTEGKGWHDARIVPYGNISLDPSAMVFHYGQEMFEGLKAYMGEDGKAVLDRSKCNACGICADWCITQARDIAGKEYTVKEGDTMWTIAQSQMGNGADYQKILDANGLKEHDYPKPGTKIKITVAN